jgi:hypothetical protein
VNDLLKKAFRLLACPLLILAVRLAFAVVLWRLLLGECSDIPRGLAMNCFGVYTIAQPVAAGRRPRCRTSRPQPAPAGWWRAVGKEKMRRSA